MSALARLVGLALFLVAGGLTVGIQRRRVASGPLAEPVWPGLALVLDVWALAMQAGAPGVTAMTEAATVAVGPCRDCMAAVVAALEAGASAAQAWSLPLGSLPPSLAAAGRAALRTESDGTALEPVLRRLADRERAALASRGLVAARRASVWVVLPLGLCYLPAYLLLGVLPAVVGLIH